MDGILNVHKPPGVTSHDVVAYVRCLTGQSRAGHCGTLDPAASGVLVVCLGKATRLAEYLTGCSKQYRAEVLLDRRTTTGDLEGEVLERHQPGPEGPPSHERLQEAVARFRGDQLQRPHRVSAVRVGGRRLYERARAGEPDVEVQPRPIRISRLDVLDYRFPRLALELECSSGTYVRQLAEDLGTALGTGGCLAALIRTHVDSLSLEDALSPFQLAARWALGGLEDALQAPERLLDGFGEAQLLPASLTLVGHGRPLARRDLDRFQPPTEGDRVKVLGPDGRLVAVYRHAGEGRLEPCKVLLGPEPGAQAARPGPPRPQGGPPR